MVIVTIDNDLLFNLANPAGIVGQQPHKKQTKLDSIGNWKLTDTLDGLKEFTFSVKNDEHEKANILIERNISVPFLTPFNGIIVEKLPGKATIDFRAVEDAWHFTRKKFNCHDKKRIKFTQENWHDNLWKFRRHIKIQGKKFHDLSTGADLFNFPLLFHTIDTELKEHARSDGFDILFTKTQNDGTTIKLQHEIESYNQAIGELWAWVEYPEIRSGQDEEFEMYFGNPAATDQQNITGTWDDYLNGFDMVQHLHANSIDSTSNNNDGTDTSITYVTGKIANAAQYDAVDSRIDCGSGASIDDIYASNGWITAWFNANSDGEASTGNIFGKGSWRLMARDETSGFVRLRFENEWDAAATTAQWDTAIDIPINTDIRVDIVYDDSAAGNNPTIYINGTPRTVGNGLTETTAPGTTADSDAANNFIIGNNTGQSATFDGEIEEVRCLKVPPTNISELIKIEYANENDPDNYFIIGQVENYIEQADVIAQTIINSANRDMPILNTTPISGLVSKWKFNGDVTDDKSSNNGTWSGSEIYTEGVFPSDRSAFLDGSSRIATANTPFSFDRTDAFSIQIKVKTSSTTEDIIVSKRVDLTAANAGYALYQTAAGLPVFEMSNGITDYTITGVTAINDNKWHTLGITYDGTSDRDGMKIYVDGFLDVQGTATAITGATTNALNLTFGAGSAGASAFTGNLDDPRVYNAELTAKQMDRLHKMTQSDLDIVQTMVQWKLGDGHITEISNLISLWKFDQSLTDSKSSNDAVVVGTTTYQDGKYNTKGLDLDGSSYATLAHTPFDFERTTAFTWSMWIKGNTAATLEEILSKHNGSLGYRIFFDASDNLVVEFDDSTLSHTWTYTTDIRDDKFHHIAITNDTSDTAAGLKIYIDGLEVTRTEAGTYPTATIKNSLVARIGADGSANNNFTGIIDDLRCYSKTLSSIEIKRLFEKTDSGIDVIRDDNIPTRLLEIDFNHKDHLQSLKKIAKELGVNIFFDSQKHIVYIKNKGKDIDPLFNKNEFNKPNFNLNNVANVVNVIGSEKEGVQKEKTFENSNNLKYNYEQTFTDGQISTDETLDLIGNNIVAQIKDLQPELTITTSPDQYNRFDVQVGDNVKISELQQDLQGIFKIIKLSLTQTKVTLSLSNHTRTTVQTSGKDIPSLLGGIINQIQDITIKPE